ETTPVLWRAVALAAAAAPAARPVAGDGLRCARALRGLRARDALVEPQPSAKRPGLATSRALRGTGRSGVPRCPGAVPLPRLPAGLPAPALDAGLASPRTGGASPALRTLGALAVAGLRLCQLAGLALPAGHARRVIQAGHRPFHGL